MGSALLNPAAHANLASLSPAPETPEELRRQVAERLAAHRERRLRKDAPLHASTPAADSSLDANKSRIAAAVAERYGKAQSYHAFLAAEAERAVQQARATAEIAARNAQAVAEAQQRLLNDLAEQAAAVMTGATAQHSLQPESLAEQALWPELDEPVASSNRRTAPSSGRPRAARPEPPSTVAPEVPDSARMEAAPALRVILYDDTPAVAPSPVSPPGRPHHRRSNPVNDLEALALDEEISFRQAPVFEEPAGPPMPLPANLLEFPRQLVASRKARPRYAEGPLRDEQAAAPAREQLRIFEVEPNQISTQPAIPDGGVAAEPQWTSLWLDTPGAKPLPAELLASVDRHPAPAAYLSASPRPSAAKLSRRMLAGSIDIAIAALAGIGCAATFAATNAAIAGQVPWRMENLYAVSSQLIHAVPLSTLALDSAAALLLLSISLQAVFFLFSDATPGMRIARIGLCTFADNNPTRGVMLLRIPALILSTAILGLGFWWALFDEDRLAWHDLITRMYQRSY